jgi:hypothetical protein
MAGILEYFDLNRDAERATGGTVAAEKEMLQSAGHGRAAPRRMPLAEQLLMYSGIVLGVLFSTAVYQFKAGEAISLRITAVTLVVSLIVAFAILPAAYEKLKVKRDAPLLVRIGLFVQHGVFWNVLFAAAGKAIAA